jgi:2-isopropylmalate synthase
MDKRKSDPLWGAEVIDANRELGVLHSLKGYEPPFRILRNYHLVDNGVEPEATIVLAAGGREIHEADTGVGPVDALANALKKALKPAFSYVDEVRLIDYSARIYESRTGTKASVEVTVLLGDGTEVWKVSEASQNINQASFYALAAGYEYAIIHRRRRGQARRSGRNRPAGQR